MDVSALIKTWIGSLGGFFTDPRALFWWPTIVVSALGALAVAVMYRRQIDAAISTERKSLASFFRELPMDIACYLGYTFTQVLIGSALFFVSVGGVLLVFFIAGGQPTRVAAPVMSAQITMAVLAFVLSDLSLYWSHRLFHRFKVLWWFHSLHHNPAVLTPITAFRFWPPEAVVHFVAFQFGEGIAFGIANLMFGANITPYTYLGVNVFWLSWYLAFSHLRHSHIALNYPRWLSHILVSPHMHQAHHSIDPIHHQCNFGTALALWDWMFGTLFIPGKSEKFRFGVVRA
ncbi:MAG: sterol desaturase family protein [Burkholderiales bacterium]